MYLGIETSCDDTSIALLDGKNIIFNKRIIQNHVESGGVVPSEAAKYHLENLPKLISEINTDLLQSITHIAVTIGPGLKQCLLTGLSFAKGLSINYKKPIIGIHHIEAHILTIGLSKNIFPPYTALVISGGHTVIVNVSHDLKYTVIGESLDDALGECFDKCGRYLGLEYPAGPKLEQLALNGKNIFTLPKPMYHSKCHNMSFAGLKTHVLSKQEQYKEHIEDFAQSFHQTVISLLIKKLSNIVQDKLIICGGVSANRIILNALSNHFETYAAPVELCTDNAAMVAWAAQYNQRNLNTDTVKPKWNLESLQ